VFPGFLRSSGVPWLTASCRPEKTGVNTIWLMPSIRSDRKQKGSLGCPYSVQNYTEVNPDFGTKGISGSS
jgi:hypothetical protein